MLFCLAAKPLSAKLDSPGTAELKLGENDWPWWRGPFRNGHAIEQSVPLHWGPDQNIVWKTSLPGQGHGSPTVVGDRIFLACADEDRRTQSIICLSRKDGRLLWKTQVHRGGWEGRIHARNTQASPTIACDGERVFIPLMHKEQIWLTALDLDGERVWQKRLSSFDSHWGYSSSPLIYENLVIVVADHHGGGRLAAFNRADGKQVWQVERPKMPNYASPVVYTLAGKDQLILPGCDMIAGYHPRSGRLLWSSPGISTVETIGTAVADGNRVYASGGYPKSETACVKADGSGELVWRNSTKVYAPSLLANRGYLYSMTDNGIAWCWDAATGQRMWREKEGGNFNASPTLVGERIYIPSEEGKTLVFSATPSGFELLAENQLGEEVWASPTICGNRIYLRVVHREGSQRREVLYCIGKSSGI